MSSEINGDKYPISVQIKSLLNLSDPNKVSRYILLTFPSDSIDMEYQLYSDNKTGSTMVYSFAQTNVPPKLYPVCVPVLEGKRHFMKCRFRLKEEVIYEFDFFEFFENEDDISKTVTLERAKANNVTLNVSDKKASDTNEAHAQTHSHTKSPSYPHKTNPDTPPARFQPTFCFNRNSSHSKTTNPFEHQQLPQRIRQQRAMVNGNSFNAFEDFQRVRNSWPNTTSFDNETGSSHWPENDENNDNDSNDENDENESGFEIDDNEWGDDEDNGYNEYDYDGQTDEWTAHDRENFHQTNDTLRWEGSEDSDNSDNDTVEENLDSPNETKRLQTIFEDDDTSFTGFQSGGVSDPNRHQNLVNKIFGHSPTVTTKIEELHEDD